MKIDNRFVFPILLLKDFIKNNWDNSITQYEILATITVANVFNDEKPGEYFIYLPMLPSHEKRFPVDKDIFFMDDFLKLFHDGNSSEDTFLLRKEDNHYAVIPIQIKRYGVGKWETESAESIIPFLEEKRNYATNEMQLIIVFENVPNNLEVLANLNKASEWLLDNDFPFKGVIVIHPFATGEMLFCQLKPTKGSVLVKKFAQDQILNN
jgi:hypothetical protein